MSCRTTDNVVHCIGDTVTNNKADAKSPPPVIFTTSCRQSFSCPKSTLSRQSVIFFTSQSHFFMWLTPGTKYQWHCSRSPLQSWSSLLAWDSNKDASILVSLRWSWNDWNEMAVTVLLCHFRFGFGRFFTENRGFGFSQFRFLHEIWITFEHFVHNTFIMRWNQKQIGKASIGGEWVTQ